MTNEEIYKRAVELYDETGPSAVYDFAIDERTCLVCGSEK